MKMKTAAAVVIAAAVLTGCGSQISSRDKNETLSSSKNESSTSSTVQESAVAAVPNSSGAENSNGVRAVAENVKLLGRTYADDSGRLWMGLSGTGVDLMFKGSSFDITMSGNQTDIDNAARVGIFVDGERVKDVVLSGAPERISISGKGSTAVNVRVVKLSECTSSCCCIESMTAQDGEFSPTPEKNRRIEFIGDSITCGYGIDDTDLSHGFSTTTEDCTKAYAVKAAEMLGADVSLFSFSGYGIVSGNSGDGTKEKEKTVPQYYSSYGFTFASGFGDKKPQDIPWDNSKFKPDVIVINLGTNDSTYTQSDTGREAEYTSDYVSFLKLVREKNPGAKIYCTLGIMGNELNDAMKRAVEKYTGQTGDKNISAFDFPVQDMNADGCVVHGHPSVKTHDRSAALLSEKIRSDMGW